MAYAAAFKNSYTLPAKYGWYLAGWAFLCTRFDTPQAGRCSRGVDALLTRVPLQLPQSFIVQFITLVYSFLYGVPLLPPG
jgi:hypothetical protein